MTTNNYFRVGKEYFFFNDGSEESLCAAYGKCSSTQGALALFKPHPMISKDIPLVGHRPRTAIQFDLKHAPNEYARDLASSELEHLETQFPLLH